MTAPHRVFDAITPFAESGRFVVGSGLRADIAATRSGAETRDRSVVALVSMLVGAVPLRSVVVATSSDGAAKVVAWASLTGAMADASEERHLIPISDRDGSFVGSLQLESATSSSEDDLAFARAIAGDIGRLAGVAAGASSQRSLLETVDLSHESTRLAALLSTIAAVCVWEEPGVRIVAVRGVSSLVDHARVLGLVERIVGGSEGHAWCASLEPNAPEMVPGDRTLVAQLGLHSILYLPVVRSENGRSRVVLLGGHDDRPFHPTLLRHVREWVEGGVAGDENDHLLRATIAGVRYRTRELVVVSHHRACEGSFVTLVDPASVVEPHGARACFETMRRAAVRLSHLL